MFAPTHFTIRTEPRECASVPSATLPSRRRSRPVVPRAPTTVISVRLVEAARRSSDKGMPRRTTASTAHPARLSRRDARDSSRRARVVRSRSRPDNSAASTARTDPGKRPIALEEVGSTTASKVTRPPRGGDSRLTDVHGKVVKAILA